MVVQVVKWDWIFDMDVIQVVVELEVDDRDNMDLGMEDIEENIEDIVDLSHKLLVNLVSKICFGVEMTKDSNEGVCSNYFEMNKLEIVNQVHVAMVFLELHNIASLVIDFLHCPLGKLPSTSIMMDNI